MGLFKKEKPTELRTIFNELPPDILSLPDGSFDAFKPDFDQNAQITQTLSKELDNKILNLFDKLQITTHEKSNYRIYYFCQKVKELDVLPFRDLINLLVDLYGISSNEKGVLNSDDIEEIEENKWLGRDWILDKQDHRVNINYFRNSGISLTVEYQGDQEPIDKTFPVPATIFPDDEE